MFLNFSSKFATKMKHLKSSGQKLTSFDHFTKWLRIHLDMLYIDEDLRNKFCTKQTNKKKSIENLVSSRSDNYQREQFYNNILTWAENYLIKRRLRLRIKTVEYVREQMHNKLDYNQRY